MVCRHCGRRISRWEDAPFGFGGDTYIHDALLDAGSNGISCRNDEGTEAEPMLFNLAVPDKPRCKACNFPLGSIGHAAVCRLSLSQRGSHPPRPMAADRT